MSRTVKNVVFAIVALLLIALLAGLAVYLMRGPGKKLIDDVKGALDPEFKIAYDGKYYKGADNVVELEDGKATFKVMNAEKVSVKVLPAVDFEFTVNGQSVHFADLNLTRVFVKDGSVQDNTIVLECSFANFDVKHVLQEYFGESAEIVVPTVDSEYLYKLVFSSGDKSIEIKFRMLDVSITLSSEHEIFWGLE